MRGWLWLIALALGVACIGGFAYFLTDSAPPLRVDGPRPGNDVKRTMKGDGDAELSEPDRKSVV